jgi:hypothetical protein
MGLYALTDRRRALTLHESRFRPSVPQDGLPRTGIRQGNILERFDSPFINLPRQHGKNQRVDRVRASRMSRTDREAAPEVHDDRIVTDRNNVDQLVRQRRIAVNSCVDRRVEFDDGVNPAHVVPEAVHECRILVEQCSKSLYVMFIPTGLKRMERFFGTLYLNHVDSHAKFCAGPPDARIMRWLSGEQGKVCPIRKVRSWQNSAVQRS